MFHFIKAEIVKKSELIAQGCVDQEAQEEELEILMEEYLETCFEGPDQQSPTQL
jgi:hypothetical protein